MPEKVDTSRVLLSTTEASKVAGFSLRYIQRLLNLKRIEGTRIGTVWLVYEDSLKTFLAQPRKQGRPKGSYREPPQDHLSTQLEMKHAKIEHVEGQVKYAEGEKI